MLFIPSFTSMAQAGNDREGTGVLPGGIAPAGKMGAIVKEQV
jgi:hypothetical protein